VPEGSPRDSGRVLGREARLGPDTGAWDGQRRGGVRQWRLGE
jgi:hypothetical protein